MTSARRNLVAVALLFGAALCPALVGAASWDPVFAAPTTRLGRLDTAPTALSRAGLCAIRGATIGPIESTLQPGRGYGSESFEETLDEVRRLGGNWVSLTVFSRVWDTKSRAVALGFERPYEDTRAAMIRSVTQAHERGLRVLLVPHLWVESGQWRAEMQPGSDAAWDAWARSYRHMALEWASAAEEAGVDLFAVGVELRSWVTTPRAPSFVSLVREVRTVYTGPLTYAANWDDVEDTVVLGELDVIGINAFYPLHWEYGATSEQLYAGGDRVAKTVTELAKRYERPVIFTEFGYTTRKDTAIEPWLWPEQLGTVVESEHDQALAYAALLSPMRRVPGFGGTFVWRLYADIADLSQEPGWGFSPRGKRSEAVMRSAFEAHYWADRYSSCD